MSVRFRHAFITLLMCGLLSGGATALADAPDFSHGSDEPHGWWYSPRGGTITVPMLVIAVTFDDAPLIAPLDTEGEIEDRFFGRHPSVRDYFRVVSRGRVQLTPAEEGSGTADDGVVIVNAGEWEPFFEQGYEEQMANTLALVDDVVDYSAFDANGDGRVDNRELVVVHARASRPGETETGGALRSRFNDGWPRDVSDELDGVGLDFPVAGDGIETNIITHAHEIAHAILELPDEYGFGAGFFALSGPTIARTSLAELHRIPNGIERVHWGWTTPQVAEADGWFELAPAAAGGAPVIAYDPAVGAERYLLLENRNRPAGASWGSDLRYDDSVDDLGVVMWSVHDDRIRTRTPEHLRPTEVVLPNGGRVAGCADEDVDGLVNEDAIGNGVVFIDGLADANGDGVIDADDDEGWDGGLGYRIIGGAIDIDDDKGIDIFDIGRTNGLWVIGGRLDVDGDGDIDEDDDGDPLTGVDGDGDGVIDEDGAVGGCGVAGPTGAWNPRDSRTPQRAFLGLLPDRSAPVATVPSVWPHRGASTVARDATRVFVDVPGPGVMVDTYPALFLGGRTGTLPVSARTFAGVVVDVANTDDPGGPRRRFEVELAPTPGWGSTVATVDLAPGESVRTNLRLTVPDTQVGGPDTLEVVAREVGGALESRSPLYVDVTPRPPDPDRFDGSGRGETRDDAVRLTWEEHTHGGLGPFGSRDERWDTTVEDLTIHDRYDDDWFTIALPDFADPAQGGHPEFAGAPECGTADIGDDQVVTTAVLETTAWARPHTDALVVDPRHPDAPAARLHELRCPNAALLADGVAPDATLSVRSDDPQALPDYDLDLSYHWEALVTPKSATYLREAEEVQGLGSVFLAFCPGGLFPACGGGGIGEIEFGTALPALPGRECLADGPGCQDLAVLEWPGTADFDVQFTGALEGTSFELLDADGAIVGQAFAMQQPGCCEEAPLGSAHGDPTHGGGHAGEEFPSGHDEEVYEPGPGPDMRLQVPDLPAGFYALRISGDTPTEFAVRSTPPPAPLGVSLVSDSKTVAEGGAVVPVRLRLENRHATEALHLSDVVPSAGVELTDCDTPLTVPAATFLECDGSWNVESADAGQAIATVDVAGTLGGVVRARGEDGVALDVEDTLPVLETSLAAAGQVEPGDVLALTDLAVNRSTEPVALEGFDVELWQDHDGDGFRGDGELSPVPLPDSCALPVVLAPGESWSCRELAVETEGQPWADPVLTAVWQASDDEGNSWGSSARTTVDLLGDRAASLGVHVEVTPHTRWEVHDDPSGYVEERSDAVDLDVRALVTPEGGPTVVTGAGIGLPAGTPATCTMRGLPAVVIEPTVLRGTCHFGDGLQDGEVPPLTVVLTAEGGISGSGEASASRPIDILVQPGKGNPKIQVTPNRHRADDGRGRGPKVAIAVLSDGTFDATTLDVGSLCFGKPGGGDCTTHHADGHIEDVDRDGDDDVLLHFHTDQTGLEPGDELIACLTGMTRDGTQVESCRVVRVHANSGRGSKR